MTVLTENLLLNNQGKKKQVDPDREALLPGGLMT
jgi:hypothetical protein